MDNKLNNLEEDLLHYSEAIDKTTLIVHLDKHAGISRFLSTNDLTVTDIYQACLQMIHIIDNKEEQLHLINTLKENLINSGDLNV